MNCLNCGSATTQKEGNCPDCNINLEMNGVCEDLKITFHAIPNPVSQSIKCVNCSEELPSPLVKKCPCCNYSFKQSRSSNGISSHRIRTDDRNYYKSEKEQFQEHSWHNGHNLNDAFSTCGLNENLFSDQ